MAKVALYPGSFDPITVGHANIIERGLHIYDQVVVAVARNIVKTALFTIEERMEMVRAVFPDEEALKVESFEGLLVDYARQRSIRVILRGLRAVADFEYEYQMANMNRHLDDHVETVFLMADPNTFYVSSRLVKEVATLGGDIAKVVPSVVVDRICARIDERREA